MTIRERLEAFWSGNRPDRIPHTIYQNEWRHTADDPAWLPMYGQGLGVTWLFQSFRENTSGVDMSESTYIESGNRVVCRSQETSVGRITAVWTDGWQTEYWLENPEDYRVMTDIVRCTAITPDYDGYLACERELPPHGIALVHMGRTPLQTILVDLAGAENFAWHLYEYEEHVHELYDALFTNFRRITEIIAACRA